MALPKATLNNNRPLPVPVGRANCKPDPDVSTSFNRKCREAFSKYAMSILHLSGVTGVGYSDTGLVIYCDPSRSGEVMLPDELDGVPVKHITHQVERRGK